MSYATSQPLGYFGDGDDNRPDETPCCNCGKPFEVDPTEDATCLECLKPMCPDCYAMTAECSTCRAAWIVDDEEQDERRAA